jgi:hypothetical protein
MNIVSYMTFTATTFDRTSYSNVDSPALTSHIHSYYIIQTDFHSLTFGKERKGSNLNKKDKG